MRKRLISCLLVSVMVFSVILPEVSFAESINEGVTDGEDVVSENIITEVEPLGSEVSQQKFTIDKVEGVILPGSIRAKIDVLEDYIDIPVNWIKPADMKSKVGTYVCTASLADDREFILGEGIELPSITVVVSKAKTGLGGRCAAFTRKSRGTIYDTVTVTNPYGRTLRLQMYTGGKWVTKKSYGLNNSSKQTLKVYYSKDWWKVSKSKWRIHIASNSKAGALTSGTTVVNTKRYYQNPSKYVQIKNSTIKLRDSGGYTLRYGYMGLKVKKVNRYFGIGDNNWPRYTYTTKSKVKSFQRKKGLTVTGNVNKATWLKMGFSEWSWYNLGAYVTPIKVNPSSSRTQHVDAMINTAKTYLGAPYVVGASGTSKQGADCSGLVMQALYAAGVDPYPVSVVRHSKPGYEYESRNLYNSSKFKKVSYSNKRRGDLIFYSGASGVVNHVAIYIGNGKVIESYPNRVIIANVKAGIHTRVKGVRRVFN